MKVAQPAAQFDLFAALAAPSLAEMLASANAALDLDPPLEPPPTAPVAPPKPDGPCFAGLPKCDVRTHVRTLARKLNCGPTESGFDRDAAWRFVTQEIRPQQPKSVMAFMAWAWEDGIHDLEVIQGFVRTWRDKGIRTPYAYFAKTGPARATRVDTAAINDGERENNSIKATERQWLDGGPAEAERSE